MASVRFAKMHADENGNNSCWTKAQIYIALGSVLHTLARLKIGSTPLEGIDVERLNKEFRHELDGYRCEVALAIGYSDQENDWNYNLPKSRRDDIFTRL